MNIDKTSRFDGYTSLTTARRPYFRLRGKPITQSQAWEIIRRTDTINDYGHSTPEGRRLSELAVNLPRTASDGLYQLNLNQWHLTDQHYPAFYGWVTHDGHLAHNGIFQKYPTIAEFEEEFTQLANEFPFLDMIIAITNWDEYCAADESVYHLLKGADDLWGYKNIDDVLSVKDSEQAFITEVIGGYWIHSGRADLLDPDEARRSYAMYNQYARDGMHISEDTRIGADFRTGEPIRKLTDGFVQYCLAWERFLSGKAILMNLEHCQDFFWLHKSPKSLGKLRERTDTLWVSKYVYDTTDFSDLELESYDIALKVLTPTMHSQWEWEVQTILKKSGWDI